MTVNGIDYPCVTEENKPVIQRLAEIKKITFNESASDWCMNTAEQQQKLIDNYYK